MKEFIIEYNNENYIQKLSIVRILSENASVNNLEYDQYLVNDMINSIQIISDAVFPMLTAKFKYTDIGNKFLHKIIPDGRSLCRISIIKSRQNTIESKFEHLFVVRDVKLLSKETNTYEVDLISHYWYNFTNLINYSTMNNKEPLASKPYTTIIYEMMRKGNIKILKPDLQTSLKIRYSTPINYSLKNSINDVLTKYDPDIGLIFLRYNFDKDFYEVISIRKLFKDLNVHIDNELIFPTKESTGDNTRMFLDTKLTNDVGFNNMMKYTAPQTIKEFSYTTRTWKDIPWNRKKISNMFYEPVTKDYEIKFKTVPNFVPSEVRNFTYETLDINFINSDPLKKLLISSETLQGNTNGILERKAGDLALLLTENLKKKNSISERFFGVWFIGRVFHMFTKNSYKNIIQMSRVDYLSQIGKDTESSNRGENV